MQSDKEEEQQTAFLNELGGIAERLHRILRPGMTVEYIIPESKIKIPGQPMSGGKIIITKPRYLMGIVKQA